ncbi:TetR/AcrR family transcriptional regulator [Sulfitobacter mediterraneus]|jgi:AcrR family transcriptional regulator|uniref:TetR family transcriptional regulator n=1 Tax=Sulfitobacter mediterraneus TaxID=83219 RepID=A0A2T6CF28_9RHOB|nr:TetR/AcrR family transcriptional regulator [Sulfitobacter mediterraneus]KIN76451.1 TetR family transcriptional regulator [Sulfitobacter mediterraneus KCTC 32188]PTX74111.1 TetR family transcriptional regulator [Sulfitobacter mediterraneus]
MRDDKKQQRRRQIEAAAYDLLVQYGYDGTSMLAVAKAAKASNETMYRWYGDKNGLFESMVRANAAEVRDALHALIEDGLPPLEILRRLAPVLLDMLLGEKAIALNRAAAADASGALGRVIAACGREEVLPLIKEVLVAAIQQGALRPPAQGEIGSLFMHLLVGDQQMRRAIGVLPAPSAAEITLQADQAVSQLIQLCRPTAAPAP